MYGFYANIIKIICWKHENVHASVMLRGCSKLCDNLCETTHDNINIWELKKHRLYLLFARYLMLLFRYLVLSWLLWQLSVLCFAIFYLIIVRITSSLSIGVIHFISIKLHLWLVYIEDWVFQPLVAVFI